MIDAQEEALFLAAHQLKSEQQRAAFLAAACAHDPALRARLNELLQAHEEGSEFLDRPRSASAEPLVSSQRPEVATAETSDLPPIDGGDEIIGALIDRYKLLQKLGEGGFGVVYMAEQREPVKRRVALKIIKLGMDTRQIVGRFEAERQALALMDHPSIAKVLDGGATASGRPYFVMELVRGVPIHQFCDEGSLPAAARLRLFIQACHAIQHAHQKGIIHRDIKPSNILVTFHDGVPVPKVIDFGIAKATQGELTDKTVFTQLQHFIGTPAYMSPEQAEMSGLDVDTRSDIYALGVLLYELLTGRTPFDGKALLDSGLDAMRRTIREVEPPLPSTRLSTLAQLELETVARRRDLEPPKLVSLLRGDLDWIVMKALEKDRTRRYDTATALAMDVDRYLASEPILARPASRAYRLGKFVRKNKLGVAAASAVVGALLAGILATSWQARRAWQAERESKLAARNQAELRQKADSALGHAKAQEHETRLNLYAADVALAQHDLQEGDAGMARERLLVHLPQPGQPDLRGFEWRYLWDRSGGDELHTFDGSRRGVWNLALSSDGHWLAVSGEVWDLRRPDRSDSLGRGRTALAFAPKGRLLLMNTPEGLARRDLATGEETLMASGEFVVSLRFSPSGRWLATGRYQERELTGALTLWETTNWTRVATVTGLFFDPRLPQALEFFPDESALLACTGYSLAMEGVLRCFRVPNLEQVVLPPNSVRDTSCIAFAPDGAEFFTGGWEGHLRCWDARSLKQIEAKQRLGHHRSWINSLHVVPGSRHLLTTGSDRRIQVWDPDQRQLLQLFHGHAREIWRSIIAPDGVTLYTVSGDGLIKQWSLTRGGSVGLLPEPRNAYYFLGSSADGTRVAALSHGDLVIWETHREASDLPPVRTPISDLPLFPVHPGLMNGMAIIAPDFQWLALACAHSGVELRNLAQPNASYTVAQAGAPPESWVAFSRDSQYLAIRRATDVIVWDVNHRSLRLVVPLDRQDGVSLHQFASAANVLAIPQPGRALLWNVDTGRELPSLPISHSALNIGFAISADAALFAAGYNDGSFTLHDCQTGRQLGPPLPAHVSGIEQLCFSTDGRTLLTASGRWLALWNVAARREVARYELPGKIFAIHAPVDGNSIVTATADALHVWHAPTLSSIDASLSAAGPFRRR